MLATAIPKPEPRRKVKARRQRSQAQADRFVYAFVTERDQHKCRMCDRTGELHRHHIRGRKFTTTADVCLLCASCHSDVHPKLGLSHRRWRLVGDANGPLMLQARRGNGGWMDWGSV